LPFLTKQEKSDNGVGCNEASVENGLMHRRKLFVTPHFQSLHFAGHQHSDGFAKFFLEQSAVKADFLQDNFDIL